MPTLTIRKVPETLYKRLKEQAQQHRRSMNSEVIVCLEQALDRPLPPPPRDPEEVIREAETLNRMVNFKFDEHIIEEGKRYGRT